MSGIVNISKGSLIRKRRDGQVIGSGSGSGTTIIKGGNSNVPSSGVVSVLDDIFEVINPATEDQYLRCKLPFAGDFEVQAWTDDLVVVNSKTFQTPVFANPLDLDASLFKDFKCGLITGNTTINLNNSADGDAGMIEIIMDSTGSYTIALGTMFTKKLGDNDLVVTANTDNFISWRNVSGDIIYTINQVV